MGDLALKVVVEAKGMRESRTIEDYSKSTAELSASEKTAVRRVLPLSPN